MAIVLTEKVKSRVTSTGENASVDFHYDLIGTSDDVVARDYALANTATVYQGLARLSIVLTPVVVDTNTDTGHWTVAVHHGLLSSGTDPTFQFDTRGGTQHITQSLETISKTPVPNATATDNQGAIGATATSVEGVDIIAPVYTWSETHFFADALITNSYKGLLFGLTGRVNANPFKGFAAGECLFMGAGGSRRTDTTWEINFRFSSSPNRTNIIIGTEGIKVPVKKGWEYLWVRYKQVEHKSSGFMTSVPLCAYVERVLESGDFSNIGIGEG